MIEPSKIRIGVCDIATSATKPSGKGRGRSSKEAATQNVANVASVASPIPKTTRAARHPRPQAGALFAVTDGRQTVGYVIEAGDHFEARTLAGELVGTYPTLAGASRSFPSGGRHEHGR
jgi:hypothetical protein